MSLQQLTLSDEQVQDIVASLINGSSNADVVYDDTNDTLTVSLSDSISVNTLEATDTINTADISAASEGDALQKGAGASDFKFGSASFFTSDGNAETLTNVTSATYTLNDTYDHVKFFAQINNTGASGGEISFRINGETGSNYRFVKEDGTEVFSENKFKDVITLAPDASVVLVVFFDGRFNGSRCHVDFGSFGGEANVTGGTTTGGVFSPLDSITVLTNLSSMSVTMLAQGADIGNGGIP